MGNANWTTLSVRGRNRPTVHCRTLCYSFIFQLSIWPIFSYMLFAWRRRRSRPSPALCLGVRVTYCCTSSTGWTNCAACSISIWPRNQLKNVSVLQTTYPCTQQWQALLVATTLILLSALACSDWLILTLPVKISVDIGSIRIECVYVSISIHVYPVQPWTCVYSNDIIGVIQTLIFTDDTIPPLCGCIHMFDICIY